MYVYVCACILAAGRQGYPPRPGRTLPCLRRGRCWHRPLGLALPQGPATGVNARPTIHSKREVEPRTADRRPLGRGRSLHRPAVGPDVRLLILCCHPHTGALWGGRFRPPQTRLPPQTSPAGVHARREDLRPPGRILARQGAAPLRRLGRHLPLQGRWMRRKAQTEGCIAGLRRRYPARPGSALPRIRRGRCWHRPGTLALPQGPRRRA